MTQNSIKEHFEANMLDGDEVQGGQMLSSEYVLEYIQEYCLLKDEILKSRPAKRKPVKCDAGSRCDGDMCCGGEPYENQAYNEALDDWSKAMGIGD